MADNTRFFFVLCSVGASLGIGSRWAFPYFTYHFGGWFYLAYFLALIILGIPFLMMEFALGQYFKKNVVDLFYSIRLFAGPIGWMIIFNSFILLTIYTARLAWHIIYLFVSFGLQWRGRAESYFFGNVLQISGAADFSDFSLAVFIAIVIAWVIIYAVVRNGFESFSKSFVWLMTIGAFIMVGFLLYFLSLKNALPSIYSLFVGGTILDLNMWISAFSLAATSIGVSFGIMHAISQKAEGFIIRSASVTVLFELLTAFALGFIFFSLAGFYASGQNTNVDVSPFSDYTPTFTYLAEALALLQAPTITSILFFVFLGLIFLMGAAALAYSIVNVLSRKLATKNRNASIIVIGFGFLFSLIFVVKPGYYVMDIMSHYFVYNILIVLLLQTLMVGFAANSRRISNYIDDVSFLKLGSLWRIIIRYVTPLILIVLISSQIRIDWMGFNSYPSWTIWVFGIGTAISSALFGFLMPRFLLDRKVKK